MNLETERLRLREYTQDDFRSLYEIMSDPITMRYYPKPYDKTGTQRWLDWSFDNYRRYGFGLWAMELKDSSTFIGDCGLTMQPIDGQELPEVGYHVHRNFWRNGYAKEAARAVRDWAFGHTDFDALYSYMNTENLPSRATAAANGMRLQKEYVDTHGIPHSVYRITREEWEQLFRGAKQ